MRNVGGIDRMLRIVVGAGLTWYAYTSGAVWGYVGLLPLATGLMGFCPAYCPLKLSTSCCSGGSRCDSKKSCDSSEKR